MGWIFLVFILLLVISSMFGGFKTLIKLRNKIFEPISFSVGLTLIFMASFIAQMPVDTDGMTKLQLDLFDALTAFITWGQWVGLGFIILSILLKIFSHIKVRQQKRKL